METNLTNYHCHTVFCDGRVGMETMIRFAIAKRFTSLGFSSHAPLPFQTPWTMNKSDMSDYFAEFRRFRNKYKDKIDLYLGLEIDYLNDKDNPSNEYFRDLPLDFRIGSVHLLPDINENIVDIDCSVQRFHNLVNRNFNNNINLVIRLYFYNSIHMVKSGGFDIVGHCDKMLYNVERVCPGKTSEEWVNQLLNNYLKLIAEKGYMVEINTKRYLEQKVFSPNEKYFTTLYDLGIPVLVNSDAHYPDKINDGRKEALSALKEAGYTTVRQLDNGKWVDVAIE